MFLSKLFKWIFGKSTKDFEQRASGEYLASDINLAQGIRKTPTEIPEIPLRLREYVIYECKATLINLYVLNSVPGNNDYLLSYTESLKRNGWKVACHFVNAEGMKLKKEEMTNASVKAVSSDAYTSTMIDVLKGIFVEAAKRNASDIHFDATEQGGYLQVKFRIDGKLCKYQDFPLKDFADTLFRVLYVVVADETDQDYWPHTDQAGQIRKAAYLPDSIASMRLQRGHQAGGGFAVLRLFPKETRRIEAVDFENLPASRRFAAGMAAFTEYGWTEDQARILTEAARTPDGAVLFSGTTGSGKSTALKVALEYQAAIYPDKSIFTIEDPVEYAIRGARQFSVPSTGKEGRTDAWLRMFRVAMRSDPDIIMVGELRDKATAETAFQAVLSGHQLWSTVHAKNAFAILTRLIGNFGLPREDLLDDKLLVALVNQTLMPALCPHCSLYWREAGDHLDDGIARVLRRWEAAGAPVDKIRVVNPQGCERCRNTGIAGRKLVAEVVEINSELAESLSRDFHKTVHEYYKDPRNFTKMAHALQKIFEGSVDPGDVLSRVGNLPADLLDHHMHNIEPVLIEQKRPTLQLAVANSDGAGKEYRALRLPLSENRSLNDHISS